MGALLSVKARLVRAISGDEHPPLIKVSLYLAHSTPFQCHIKKLPKKGSFKYVYYTSIDLPSSTI
ncbi:hypothetical protein DZB82_08140 [Bacillus sp. dmp5]|nr:hypothetical protein DZB82_08140 [Bacillus sp. dmp5]